MSVHQKLGIILESKVVLKWSLEKNVCSKKWSPKLIFLNDFFFFLIQLKVQFCHFLMNRNSLTDLKKKSFEYVDSWPKILLFRTHHL